MADVPGGARQIGSHRIRGGVDCTELPTVGAGVVGLGQSGWGRGEFGLAVLADRSPGSGAGDAVDGEPLVRLQAADGGLRLGTEFSVHRDMQGGLQAPYCVGFGARFGFGGGVF